MARPWIATIALLSALLVFAGWAMAEDEKDDPAAPYKGFELRSIGPALMSGRIADIQLHPNDPNTWYVGVGSGGVWKTTNAATTWTPIFDDQGSYSIGCIAIDPSNPNVIWVGTGEDVGGRHVGYGDGIYRSADGGDSWKNMGLKDSEHITKIIVHPEDSNTIYVAAQGPLWSAGGERGFFKSQDGGESWTKTLGDDEFNGLGSLVMDPFNSDVLYAATWQHHRTVAAYMGGGPKTRIHRSDDGGDTWRELAGGLPTGNMGKVGLAISPHTPNTIYAAIETDRRDGGVYRSTDGGASWEKRSDTVSGGTGPHYYQELYVSPHHSGRLYLVSNTSQISYDAGASFESLNNEHKHVDDHAIAFRPDDPDYIMYGCDGGLYESFDHTQTWRYIDNLPITQFYKVSVDDDMPFYNVYGGTQDNNSQGGPSRTDNVHGIRNSDWFITLFGDGHDSATEPGNPDIVYSEWQQGNLVRYDRTVGEIVYIQPQPRDGEPPERFNWDAPILVSPHSPTRVYHASQRVWRTDNRGDSWTPISGDLTRNEDRMLLPIMGRQQSWDAPWDMLAMSQYNSITSLAESPIQEGLLYAGTDDGLIQVTEDGGETWRRKEVGDLPGVPDTAFVNDIKADLFDADTVYIALDNHKHGDFAPYLLKSTDRGRSWDSISSNLPERHLVWRVVQDHVKPELMFAGTEFGVFFTIDGGERWIELSGGAPTISFRDLEIHRRENDLVGATFGRGFYILDDYAPLREISPETLESDGALFTARKAWWYIPRAELGFSEKASQGHAFFTAPNPPFGAVLTYYLPDDLQTKEAQRQEREKKLAEDGEDTPFPGWEAIREEQKEPEPQVLLTIRDAAGDVIQTIDRGPTTEGFHRVAWNLRYAATQAIGVGGSFVFPDVVGPLAPPGSYTAELAIQVDGVVTKLAGPVSFEVERMTKGTLHTQSADEVVAFWKRLDDLQRVTSAIGQLTPQLTTRIDQLGAALARTQAANDAMRSSYDSIRDEWYDIRVELGGTPEGETVNLLEGPSVDARYWVAAIGTSFSTYGPTPMHEENLGIAERQLEGLKQRLIRLTEETIPAFEQAIADAGGPWVPGMPISTLD